MIDKIILCPHHTTTFGSTQNNSNFVHFVMAPSDWESNSFSTRELVWLMDVSISD